MKKIYLTFVLVSIAIYSMATILHVDQNQNRPAGYYSDLQFAINSATASDTIYVYPASSDYGSITLNKKLHIFGAGYDGSLGGVSRVNYFYLDTTSSPSSNPSGSSIQGLTINNVITLKPNINNIKVYGNYIYGSYISVAAGCSGWVIQNNYIANSIELNNSTSILISNNIFSSHDYGINYSNSSTVVITHNLFLGWRYFYNVHNATVSNNIFICTFDQNQSYMSGNVFVNNISWRSTTNPYSLPPTGNTGANNISNQDPLFETGLSSGSFDYTKDYHLKSTSPGKNAASDGTDIGPYGGTNPFIWGGAFTIPFITEMYISNPVINQGTNINVKIEAKKADL